MNREERRIYNQAVSCINKLVKETMQRCDEIADENDFEKYWIRDEFKNAFNKEMKKK